MLTSPAKLPKKIGILQHIKTLDAVYDGFKAGLTELGYKEGVDVTYDFQTTGGVPEKAGEIAKKLINNNPDLILAITTPVVGPALKENASKLGLKIVEYEFKNLPRPESLIDAILTLPEPVVNSQPEAHEILNSLGLRIKAPTLFLNLKF